jgi:T-complex protein 1 subunit eta
MNLQPNIILLKDDTETQQGKGQVISNINSCCSVVDIVKTTLGPRGMDKFFQHGKKSTITNDGATVVNLLEVEHPAAKILVDIAKSQDAECGDGTTTVMVLAGEFMKSAKKFIEDGVHPRLIMKAFRKASDEAVKLLNEISVKI